MVNRIENLIDDPKAKSGFDRPDERLTWLVWGTGSTDGTAFGDLAKRVGWYEAAHPYRDHDSFDPDSEWAVVMVCTYRELKDAEREGDPVDGLCELKGFGHDLAPGFGHG